MAHQDRPKGKRDPQMSQKPIVPIVEKLLGRSVQFADFCTGEETVKREIAVWDDNPEQQYSREEFHEILEKAVEGLKPDFRIVFTLRDIEELSTEETAETLGISIPAVKSRLLRARLALREKLTRQFRRKEEDPFGNV